MYEMAMVTNETAGITAEVAGQRPVRRLGKTEKGVVLVGRRGGDEKRGSDKKRGGDENLTTATARRKRVQFGYIGTHQHI